MFYSNVDEFHKEFLNQKLLSKGKVVYFAFSDQGTFLANPFELFAGGEQEFSILGHNFLSILSSGFNFLDSKTYPDEDYLTRKFTELKEGRRPVLFFEMPILLGGLPRFVSFTVYHSEEKKCFIAIARRLHSVEKEIADFYQRTIHDVTTGLLNKAECLKAVNQITPTEEDTYLIFLDLVRFKLINDVYGHMVGDEVLGYFAKALTITKLVDSEAYRFGGDEFVVIAKHSSREALLSFFDTLSSYLSKENKFGIQLSFSAGVTQNSVIFPSPLVLVRCSDHGMYQAKRTGNQYYFMSNEDCDEFIPKE